MSDSNEFCVTAKVPLAPVAIATTVDMSPATPDFE